MDVEKTIEFILQQQARLEATFAARMDRLAEAQAELTQAHSRQQGLVGQLIGLMLEFGTVQRTLVEAQIRTEEKLQALAEAQQQTDRKLNALIQIVDDLIRRDGRPPAAT